MRTARLLLVDDDRDNLDVLALLLGEKYSVVCCNSAADAFEALQTTTADVLILDIGMADMDGLQCLSVIRGMPRYATTPAIALTGFARDVERQQFLEGGFQAVVTKPVLDHEQLETIIDSMLEPATALAAPHEPANGCHDGDRAILTPAGGPGIIPARGASEQ